MMKTILYNGMELEEFNPDKSVCFNPPIKCVGWNNEDVKVEFELSSALSKDIWIHRFIGKSKDDKPVAFMFCALLKDKHEALEKMLQYTVLYQEKCRDINTQERFFAKKVAYNKHKRCLAMAKWCRLHDEFTQLESVRLGLPHRAIFMEYRRKAMWWNKWHKRWLELAEKFKEAK